RPRQGPTRPLAVHGAPGRREPPPAAPGALARDRRLGPRGARVAGRRGRRRRAGGPLRPGARHLRTRQRMARLPAERAAPPPPPGGFARTTGISPPATPAGRTHGARANPAAPARHPPPTSRQVGTSS